MTLKQIYSGNGCTKFYQDRPSSIGDITKNVLVSFFSSTQCSNYSTVVIWYELIYLSHLGSVSLSKSFGLRFYLHILAQLSSWASIIVSQMCVSRQTESVQYIQGEYIKYGWLLVKFLVATGRRFTIKPSLEGDLLRISGYPETWLSYLILKTARSYSLFVWMWQTDYRQTDLV